MNPQAPNISPAQAALASIMIGATDLAVQLHDAGAENALQQLFAAERMLATAAQAQRQLRSRRKTPDVAARRAREKRRQKAKQAARRLKASRS